ncbi:MAG: DUF4397 domain-containing protein [Pseudomonadota bacterium]
MTQLRIFLPLLAALLISACGGESALPNPTGKASVRAINAIKASSTVDFRIEERSIGAIEYREISTGDRFDDFTYTFNFDLFFPGDAEPTRLISESIDFVANQDYTLLLSGTVAAPSVTVWEMPERVFDTGETVFQARFAHTSDSLAAQSLDVYFLPEGTMPVAGEESATVTFGNSTPPIDFEAGDYVLTLTTAGDINDVLFTSGTTTIGALEDLIVTPFDGTPNDTAPLVMLLLGSNGNEFLIPDPNSPSQIQFLHAAADAGDVDVYDDVDLMSQVVDDLTYQQLTPEQTLAQLDGTYSFTPFDGTGTVFVEREVALQNSIRYRMILSGSAGEYAAVLITPDRRPLDTAAKLVVSNETQNFGFVTLYAMDPGEVPDATSPVLRSGLTSGFGPVVLLLEDGTFDLYVSESGTDPVNLLAGPVTIDVVAGDVLDFVVFDNAADPAIVDFVELVETP